MYRKSRIAENLHEEIKRFKLDGYKYVKARILSSNLPSLKLFAKFKFRHAKTFGEWIEVEGGI